MIDQHLVRDAVLADVERIVELWAEHVDFHAKFDPRFRRNAGSEEGFAEHLRSHLGQVDFLLLVGEVGGEVEGFLHGELWKYPPCFAHRSHGVIHDLAVTPRRQRAGLGTALLREGMAWFSARGMPTVEGKVLLSNPVAVGFWEKTGFEAYMHTIRASTKLFE